MKAPCSLFPAVMPDTRENATPEPKAEAILHMHISKIQNQRNDNDDSVGSLSCTDDACRTTHAITQGTSLVEEKLQFDVCEHARGVNILFASNPLDGHCESRSHTGQHCKVARLHPGPPALECLHLLHHVCDATDTPTIHVSPWGTHGHTYDGSMGQSADSKPGLELG